MSRIQDKEKAINLRVQGWTYSSIKKELRISKSTLSSWLSKFPLTEKQLSVLKKNKNKSREIAIEKTRATKKEKRDLRLKQIYTKEKLQWTDLTERELQLAGLFLYWGEGNKSLLHPVSLNNTDPSMVKFTLFWLTKGLKVPKEKIKIYVHLYSDMDTNQILRFWSNELQIPLSQFGKPYIKKSKKAEILQKGFSYGTCGLYVTDVRLKEKVIMGIKVIADYYSNQI